MMFDANRRVRATRVRLAAALLLAALPVIAPAVAQADPAPVETTDARLRRIEGELRALQRKVFPDGAGRTFAPEIAPPSPATGTPATSGNASAVSDLLVRMDAVESQLKALTAASEDGQSRLGKLESRVDTLEAAATPAQTTTPPPASAAPARAVGSAIDADLDTAPAPAKPAKGAAATPKPTATPAPRPTAKPAPTDPATGDHAAGLAAIERPSTDDKGEDAYTYGYRLWEAKFFPEAESTLLDFVQQYPRHKRISYARNLLGRAYLDDNKPGAAAQWFVQNYQADKAGDRASDSLLYLAVAMTRLKETKRACIALSEFAQTYPADAGGRLKGQYDAVTKMVTCR